MNKATIKVLIAMLLWGSLGVFVKNISLDSVEIAFFRGIIGSVFLGIVLFIRMQNNKKLEQENDKLNNDFEDEDKKESVPVIKNDTSVNKEDTETLDSLLNPNVDADAPLLPQDEDEDTYDLQKELEAKFDELFGPLDDDE